MIGLGDVIRQTENDFALVECFAGGSRCHIQGTCRLPPILDEALAAMFAVLDRHTLADLLQEGGQPAQRVAEAGLSHRLQATAIGGIVAGVFAWSPTDGTLHHFAR
jgi:DNA-binding IscR family transcriptional regulator